MGDAGEARLAVLLPDARVQAYIWTDDTSRVRVDLLPSQAAALADEIEAGRAAVAAVARVEADNRKIQLAHIESLAERVGDLWQEISASLPTSVERKSPEDRTEYENHMRSARSLTHNAFKTMAKALRILMDENRRALAPATGTDAASGDGDG